MKKMIPLLIFLFIIEVFFTGCTGNTGDFVQQIVPPKNLNIPIEGTWEVISILKEDRANLNGDKDWIGEKMYFTREGALLGEYFLSHPAYSFKMVEGRDYLLYNHQSFPEDYSFDQEEIHVINVTDNKNTLWELIKIKEDEIILKMLNNSYRAKKISETVHQDVFKPFQKNTSPGDVKQEQNAKSINAGVLLGLRSPSSKEDYQYRTLWIGMKDQQVLPVKKMSHIIFPRKNGFYELKIERSHREDVLSLESILADPASNNDLNSITTLKAENNEEIYRKIHYVGNDYLSIEETRVFLPRDTTNKHNKSYLKMLAVDSLPNIKAIKISDLLGETGRTLMEDGVHRLKGTLNADDNIPSKIQETNFGLARKMGYWFLRGRITPTGNNAVQWDYNINLIPFKPIIFYNELGIPWTEVKDQIPSAIDVFTSPGRNMALVVTKKEIYVYQMEQGVLKSLVEKIPLQEGECVIMAEWATGPYVENWDASLSKYIAEKENQ